MEKGIGINEGRWNCTKTKTKNNDKMEKRRESNKIKCRYKLRRRISDRNALTKERKRKSGKENKVDGIE